MRERGEEGKTEREKGGDDGGKSFSLFLILNSFPLLTRRQTCYQLFKRRKGPDSGRERESLCVLAIVLFRKRKA